jgi:hypothetical protein
MSSGRTPDDPKSAAGGGPGSVAAEGAPRRAPGGHRLHRLWWGVTGCAVCLFVALMLLLRTAVQHQLVQTDLDAAAAAFANARQARAHEFAPEIWSKATNDMAAAMAELHRQQSRFVLVRGYPRVHELLTTAIAAAQQAKASAEATAAQADGQRRAGMVPQGWAPVGGGVASHDAAAAISAARAALDHALKLFDDIQSCSRARRAKEVRLELETFRKNLDAYKAQISQLDDKYARGLLAEANSHADTLKGQIEPLGRYLEAILVKFGCNR